MKNIVILVFLAVQFSFANDMVWSKTGHRVIGHVAQEHLSRKAERAIHKILKGQSLAAVANFADEIKADKKFRKFSPWHYVNFPTDKRYNDVEPSPYGDLIMGINTCISIIKNPVSTDEDVAFYLKFLVHLMGDLHQPMHVGRAEDKGGNNIQVQWFDKGSNLHRIWDSAMIDDYGMSYTELSAKLPVLSKTQLKELQKGDVYDWVEESQDIANTLYDSVTVGEQLYYQYSYQWWDTLETQLQKGGIRLATVLNRIFK